jgi:predicted permease
LKLSAWGVVTLLIIMIGFQLSYLGAVREFGRASICLAIKMVVVPLVVGTGLMFFGVTGWPRLAIVLQMGMPPSIATVIYATAYGLDRDLSVATVAFGSVGLLLTLPVWLWLFAP